ncbi:MAG: hypothetical protein R3E87_00320 [Burkholderiaceae bacterium]
MTALLDMARRLLGRRSQRALDAPGAPPAPGTTIHFSGARMRVTAPPSGEFWAWLSLMGWRENMYPGDRRRYDDLPDEAFRMLATRRGASREAVYHQLMRDHHDDF